MSVLDSFFNNKPKVTAPQDNAQVEFKPSAKKGQNGVYKAVVRFVPHTDDPNNKSVLQKFSCWLTNPVTNTRKEIDCPSTVGEPDPIQNTFFALRNSANPILKENSKHFSRRQSFTSMVQVLKCPSEPQLENKILIWRYGIKIYEKIVAEFNPPMGEPGNPFAIIGARPFSVECKEVSGFNNYDNSQFFSVQDENATALRMVVNNQIIPITAQLCSTEEGQKQVLKYFKDNCPDTSRYEYHPWDDDTTKFVNECIQVYSDPNRSIAAAATTQGMVPQMGMPNTMPGMMPQMGMPTQVPQIPQPSMGNAMPTAAPTQNFSSNIPGNVADIIGSAGPIPTPSTSTQGSEDTPNMGLGIDDILNGQMI